MNKQVIKDNWESFCHWKDGGEVLAKHPEKGWIQYYGEDIWTHKNILIVINDKYVEFRKALAEGKTVIIVDDDSPHGDIGIKEVKCQEDLKMVHERHLRIKPDEPMNEPKFKVGDWVRLSNGSVAQIDMLNAKDGTGVISFGDFEFVRNIELWEPKEGDVVVCWDNKQVSRIITTFKQVAWGQGREGLFKDTHGKYYDNCIPHIGQDFKDMK